MPKTYTAQVRRYDDKLGRCGKLLGLVTFSDGKSLKVWDADLHAQCRQLAAFPAHDVRYSFRHSDKWGDALATVESTLADHELADLAREQDEKVRGYAKANSFLGHQISKGVQRRLDEEHVPDFDDVRRG